MKEELTRRDFLKAAGLAAAGVAGAAVLSRSAGAQEPEQEQEPKKDEDEDPKKDEKGQTDDSSQTEETRACPQCGALMYKQGRTWTCENCGYSYVE